jgi:hypothetical protein
MTNARSDRSTRAPPAHGSGELPRTTVQYRGDRTEPPDALKTERGTIGARDTLQRTVEQRTVRRDADSPANSPRRSQSREFCEVMNTRPVRKSCTGWFAP